MTLAEVTFPVSLEWARAHLLVFEQLLADRLAFLNAQHGTPNCWPIAAPTVDGRHYLYADILTEVMPGGMLHAMWEAADKSVLLPAVEVIPIADAVALLPLQDSGA